MNQFGLSARTLNELRTYFAALPQIEWVKVYGSRAMGNFDPGSDIDLAYAGPQDITGKLLSELDELSTPYLFDVTHYDTLTHAGLKDHIDRVGQLLYQRTKPQAKAS